MGIQGQVLSSSVIQSDLRFQELNLCWTPVAHAYNPSYFGGIINQEDQGSR
jgi:hypothetical protein